MKNIIVLFMILALFSCAELRQFVEDRPLTHGEVINGLKEALKIGIENASGELAKLDGYYGDELVRISLPPEASIITDNIHRVPGGSQMLENVIVSINRSAEHAAKEAAPIFVNAITKMTIEDGFAILRGNDDAATQYLKTHTYNELYSLYKPRVHGALDQKLVAGVSANEAWQRLTSQYNRIARSTAGRLAGLTAVDINLEDYLTHKALDGLFFKLSQEEYKIRTDLSARVTELLRRVFA